MLFMPLVPSCVSVHTDIYYKFYISFPVAHAWSCAE